MNTRKEKSMKDYEKMSEKKLKDISNTINQNSEKLSNLIEQNSLLKNEIMNLTKILELTMEQNKLKKEIKANESKFIKTINPQQHTYNDPSVTGNDILQELNGLKDEEEKKRSFNPTGGNIIAEEHDNKNNITGMEHQESNKNIKCKKIIIL